MYPSTKYTPKKIRREKTTLSSSSESSSKEPVHVYCRLRPLKEDRESSCMKLISPTVLSMTTPNELKGVKKEIHYKFKHIFTSFSPQKEVFDHIACPLLEDLIKGKNGLLFTYGITGSGKTYTLSGEPENPGIMPRSIHTIFNSIGDHQAPKYVIKSDKMNGFEVQSDADAARDRRMESRAERIPKTPRRINGEKVVYVNDGTKVQFLNDNNLYAVFVSYIEIYNNIVFDLLDEWTNKGLQSKILREDAQKNMYVNGAIEVEVKSAEEAFEVFNSGQKRKRMGHTVLNSESSRSHSIFNIRVVQLEQLSLNSDGQPMVPDENFLKIGQLSLVDLAGSERTNRTQNTGARLKEASSINNSLMSLRTCLEIMRENQQNKSNKLVPYRDSRLTLLFKNYFEGSGSVQMIVCVNPSVDDFDENLHVMKFAEMSQDVKIIRVDNRFTPIKKTIDRTPVATPKTRSTRTFSHFPDIKVGKMSWDDVENCGESIDKVIKMLRIHQKKKRELKSEVDQKTKDFRKRLLEINQDNVVNKSELKSLKTVVYKERQKSQNIESKVLDLETVNDSLAAKNNELQDVIRSLQNKINEKDLKINQNILEKEKTKQKLALQKENMTQELDAKLRRQRQYLSAEMKEKENKLKKVREVLDTPPQRFVEVIEKETEEPPEKVAIPEIFIETPHRRERTIASTPRHRRSKSAGERWLEHNAVKPVPLGTVLQPSMKKRKSVTKLSKASDVTNPKQSKYCLIAQEHDVDGEVETKLYKGDIVPTCGGGAQVIFNDVEKLRQESPTK